MACVFSCRLMHRVLVSLHVPGSGFHWTADFLPLKMLPVTQHVDACNVQE